MSLETLTKKFEENGFNCETQYEVGMEPYIFIEKYGITTLVTPNNIIWDKQRHLHQVHIIDIDEVIKANLFEAEFEEVKKGYLN